MGNLVDTLFGGGQGKGYEDLQKYIQQGKGQRTDWEGRGEQALSPYMGDPRLQNQYESAIQSGADPAALYNKMMSTYSQSPMAKIQQQAGIDTIQSAAAPGGMHGSGQEMQELQRNGQNISAADQNDYLAHLLGIRSDYLNRAGHLADTENANQYGARTNIGNWRYGTGGALDEDTQAQGKARAAEDMGRASGWSNLLNKGVDLARYFF